jgi:HSP20 family protein
MNAVSLWNRKSAPLSNGRIPRDEPAPFADFHREMDQLLDQAFTGFGFTRHRRPMPAVEVREAEKEYLVSVDLPGVEMKDIELSFSEGMLSLKAQRPAEDGDALYSSRWSGRFERVIAIGTDVDDEHIRATLKNGVLAVTLPKSPEHLPRRIQIE